MIDPRHEQLRLIRGFQRLRCSSHRFAAMNSAQRMLQMVAMRQSAKEDVGQNRPSRPNTQSGRSTANVLRLSCHNNDMIETAVGVCPGTAVYAAASAPVGSFIETRRDGHGWNSETRIDRLGWPCAVEQLVCSCTDRCDGSLRRQDRFAVGHGVHEGRNDVLHREVQRTVRSTSFRCHQQAAWRWHHHRLFVCERRPVLRRAGRHDGRCDRPAVRQQSLHLCVLQFQSRMANLATA